MDMKRIFQHAVQDATSSAHRPASGSQGCDAPYGGSRRVKQRFEYGPDSKAAFVELHPSFMPTPEEFKAHLEAVPGVTKVDWQTSKRSQGNVGNHYCEHNLLVYSSTGPGSASPPIEFELTRNQHVKDHWVKPTVTAMFKDPPEGLIGEAWRILLGATTDKLLLPEHARQYRKKHVLKWEGEEPVSDSDSGALAAGSTNPEPPVGEPISLDACAPGFPAAASAEPPVGEPMILDACAPGFPAAASAAGAHDVGARPSSASQPAEEEAPGHSLEPPPVDAIAAPSPPTLGDADMEPSGAGPVAELAVLDGAAMQGGREALEALNIALWEFFFQNGYRIVWDSRNPAGRIARSFSLGAAWCEGNWMELARIDNLRGTEDDDPGNWWWERASIYDGMKSVSALRCAP